MLQRLALLVPLVLAPALALGQLNIVETNDQDLFVNIDECTPGGVSDGLTFRWTVPSAVAGGSYELFASDTSGCTVPNTNNGSTAVTFSLSGQIPATGPTGSFPLSGSTNVKTLLQQLKISCNSASSNIFFCVDLIAGGTTTKGIVQASLRLDLQLPAQPHAVSADGAESALNVTWQEGNNVNVDAGSAGATNGYRVYAVPVDGSAGEKSQDFTGEGTLSGRITGLKNGTLYDVQVAALSPGNNLSARSNTIQGTPEPVNDFWRTYHNAGGREQGGCATGAAGLAALVLIVPLAFRRSRRRP